jgi:pimeloyl-ACP methyl ester carboxylesterase
MIHGMWGGPRYWENYKSFFEKEDYRYVTTTLRFHNMDPNDGPDHRLGTTSLLDYAKDLEQEIQKLGVKPVVMGHSMGQCC